MSHFCAFAHPRSLGLVILGYRQVGPRNGSLKHHWVAVLSRRQEVANSGATTIAGVALVAYHAEAAACGPLLSLLSLPLAITAILDRGSSFAPEAPREYTNLAFLPLPVRPRSSAKLNFVSCVANAYQRHMTDVLFLADLTEELASAPSPLFLSSLAVLTAPNSESQTF